LLDEIMGIYNDDLDWKLETEMEANASENTAKICIYTKHYEKIGKVFRLESFLQYNDSLILKVLRDDFEDYPNWNVTVKLVKVK
jgi:hypothetical protein